MNDAALLAPMWPRERSTFKGLCVAFLFGGDVSEGKKGHQNKLQPLASPESKEEKKEEQKKEKEHVPTTARKEIA